MTTMGELLRGGRDRSGMTVEEVADVTNMPRDTITALEQDEIAVLPEAPFTRGFIRIYSRVLGMPAEPVLEAYSRALGVQQYVLDEPVRQLRRRRVTRLVAGVFALVVFVIGLGSVIVFATQVINPETQLHAVNMEVQRIEQLREGSVVEFYVLRPCEFEVLIDGRLGFNGKISAGSRQEWVPQSEMRVTASEGNAIEVRIDGQKTGALGPRGGGVQRTWRVLIQ